MLVGADTRVQTQDTQPILRQETDLVGLVVAHLVKLQQKLVEDFL